MLMRLMCEEDISKVRSLEEISFSDPWSATLLRQGLGSSLDTFWVLEEDGQLLGYANLRIVAGEGEIMRIAVSPGVRGRGLGRKLMEQMAVFARNQGVHQVSLEVRTGNKAAISLYESCGFLKEAVRKGYYREPAEDAVIMWNRRI